MPESTTLAKALSEATSYLMQTGAVDGGVISLSSYMGTGLYKGTYPETVVLSLTSSAIGAHLVHMMTELGNGSPEATPCVKFKPVGLYGELPLFRLLTYVYSRVSGIGV